MKTLILIPARMASTRFPNKPMIRIQGKPMIQRVWEQAIASKLGNVIVACSEKVVFEWSENLRLNMPTLPPGPRGLGPMTRAQIGACVGMFSLRFFDHLNAIFL